jgi:uncharacterized membrane protein YqaE (UPF0057 family)
VEKLPMVDFIRNVKFANLILLKMKKILFKLLLFIVLTTITLCLTSNVIAQNLRIEKRKFSKGYHISLSFKNHTKSNHSVENTVYENKNILNQETTPIENTSVDISAFISENSDLQSWTDEKIDEEQLPEIVGNEFVNSSLNTTYKQQKTSFKFLKKKVVKTTVNKKNNSYKKQIKNILKSQKSGKINDDKLLFILLLILAFIIPPLAVLLYTNIDWKKVLISLILSFLWFVPGVIYSILVLLEIL